MSNPEARRGEGKISLWGHGCLRNEMRHGLCVGKWLHGPDFKKKKNTENSYFLSSLILSILWFSDISNPEDTKILPSPPLPSFTFPSEKEPTNSWFQGHYFILFSAKQGAVWAEWGFSSQQRGFGFWGVQGKALGAWLPTEKIPSSGTQGPSQKVLAQVFTRHLEKEFFSIG